MYTFRKFSKAEVFLWSVKDLIFFFIISIIPAVIYYFLRWDFLAIPSLPVGLLGTAVAFNLGFKNSNSYDRSWEARKIWGGIINYSRTFTVMTLDYINDLFLDEEIEEEELKIIKKRMVYRHIAWLTALRYQLRADKPWEHHNHDSIIKFKERGFVVPEEATSVDVAINKYLSKEEKEEILAKVNPATNLLRNQSKEISDLRNKDLIDDFRHMEFNRVIEEFYNLQGKSERIKNYPLPRQYATVSYYFVMLFILIIPFAMLSAFDANDWKVFLIVPFSMMVSWVFFTMEKIGDYSENPFEGVGNDVPITALARTIEIDMREMLGEKELPPALQPIDHILM